jgi:hypothetical protein
VRVVNNAEQCIGYRLHLIGVRVYRDYCQLTGLVAGKWDTIGPPRLLPVTLPTQMADIQDDALFATVYQYDRECPGSDLLDVLARRKRFDDALNPPAASTTVTTVL